MKAGWVDSAGKACAKDTDEEQALRSAGKKRARCPAPGSEAWRKSASKGARNNMVKRRLDAVLGPVEGDDE
jgi:hypothetical protein